MAISVGPSLLGLRIRALRKHHGLSQAELSRRLGFANRQTVSAIETGERRVTAEELLRAAEALDESLDSFTDSFRLLGEGEFSWRHAGVPAEQLRDYESTAGRWIAMFRMFAPHSRAQPSFLRQSLRLTRSSRFEDAMRAGEQFASRFELGDAPARHLAACMEERLGILVLMVDGLDGFSGAACRLPELDAVLIARREVEGRRHFDLARELFHILTWDAMPPKRSEDARSPERDRVEQLADNFAAAVLMPQRSLGGAGSWRCVRDHDLASQVTSTAARLAVASSALRSRLANLGWLEPKQARAIPAEALRHGGRERAQAKTPDQFSKVFVEALAAALEDGLISVRRAARELGLTGEGLANLLASHGVAVKLGL